MIVSQSTRHLSHRSIGIGLLTFAASRVLVFLGFGIVAVAQTQEDARNGLERVSMLQHVRDVISSWDGYWYLSIVEFGYPRSVPEGVTYFMLEARAAFFPGFPVLVYVLDNIIPGSTITTAMLLNLVLGATGVVLVGMLTKRLASEEAAVAAMVLCAMFPGSFSLSMAYSEALMVVAVGFALIAMVDDRWLLAGVAGAVATMTRPNAIALGLACLAAVAVARTPIRRRAMIAVSGMLIGAGFAFTQWYIGNRAGEPMVWFRIQREAWGEGFSFGASTLRLCIEWLMNPLSSPTRALTMISVVTIAIGIFLMKRVALHRVVTSYSVGVLLLTMTASTTTPRPRFVFVALGPMIAAAVWWIDHVQVAPHRRRTVELAVIGTCATGLVSLSAIYGLLGAIP